MPVRVSRACTRGHAANSQLDKPAQRYCSFRTARINNGCASRVGLTPSPTCLPGQGGPARGCGHSATKRAPRSSALLGQTDGGNFMSETSKRTPDKSGMPFVDPWVKEPNHQGGVPVDAVFVGAWHNYLGIDSLYEAFFLVRDDRQDLLWSLATHSEKSTKQNLAAREGGDPEWAKSKITCGCVAGVPREGTENRAARRLLGALVHARVPYEFPQPPYLPGL